jgi:hypothetical protein
MDVPRLDQNHIVRMHLSSVDEREELHGNGHLHRARHREGCGAIERHAASCLDVQGRDADPTTALRSNLGQPGFNSSEGVIVSRQSRLGDRREK